MIDVTPDHFAASVSDSRSSKWCWMKSAIGTSFAEGRPLLLLLLLASSPSASSVSASQEQRGRPPGAALPPPLPIATSYASLDPAASAAFAIKFLGALPAPRTNLSLGNCGAAAEAVMFPGSGGYRLEFVKPGSEQPCLGVPIDKFVAMTEAAFGDLNAQGHQGVYSQWEDNHIGMISHDMDPFVSALEALSQPFFMRGVQGQQPQPPQPSPSRLKKKHGTATTTTTTTAGGFFDLFVALPFTGHIFEQTALHFAEKRHPDVDMVDWDLCSYEPPPAQLLSMGGGGQRRVGGQSVLWRKMTFASADPQAAQDFAVKYLGASVVPQPHEGADGECALIKWVEWPGVCNEMLCYQWHFVRADRKGVGGTGSMNITDWRDLVEARRDVKSQVFDAYMWYHVKLWVADLDPYVTAFQADGLPFLVRGWAENGVWAVVVDMPGNGDTIMLVSDHLTAYQGPRLPFDLCH